MRACEFTARGKLAEPVHVTISDPHCDFHCAMEIAKAIAQSSKCNPMLIGSYDNVTGIWSPKKTCPENEPECTTCMSFESGDLAVDVNDQDYVFVFRGYDGWQR